LLKVSELTRRDFVNVVDGRRLGPVKDMHIDEKGMVTAVVLQPGKKHLGLFRFGRDLVVPWSRIKRIGVDTVLVEVASWERAD